jgi:hypothetical protein
LNEVIVVGKYERLWMALSDGVFNTFSAHAKLENDMAVSMLGLNEWPTFVPEREIALA